MILNNYYYICSIYFFRNSTLTFGGNWMLNSSHPVASWNSRIPGSDQFRK